MKVLMVSHENNLGGGAKSLLGLIDQFKKNQGIQIVVFVPKFNEKTSTPSLIDELKKRKIPFLYERAYWWMYPQQNRKNILIHHKDLIKVFTSFLTCLRIRKKIINHKFDIIHSNSSVTPIGMFLSKLCNIKHVWHLREFGKEDHGLEFVLNKKLSLFMMKKNTNKFICISKSINQKYSQLFGDDMCKVVYNGIESKKDYVEPRIAKNQDYKLLISGRIKESKGQIDAVKAVNVLVNKGYKNIVLYIIGNANNDYLKIIENYIKDNKIENNIIIKPFMQDLDSFRKNIDIELVCSKMEAFGRVTIEAMLSSNPVIGANTGGTKELIINNETGLLYTPKDYKELASKIELLINNHSIRKKISRKAYDYAKEMFTASRNSKEIEKIYKDCIKE